MEYLFRQTQELQFLVKMFFDKSVNLRFCIHYMSLHSVRKLIYCVFIWT